MALLADHPYLALAQMAFMLWMMVDAYTRRAESFWLWVILFVPVLGAWAYFFAVKAGDFRHLSLPAWFQRRPSLDELRYRAEQVPTLASHLAYAERLMELGQYAEAIPQLEEARKKEVHHGQVLYALAVSHAAEGNHELALAPLEDLTRRDPRWSNYAAWRLLVETRVNVGDRQGALDACRELVKLAPTLQHRCFLAEQLLDGGQAEEARKVLDRALQEYHFAGGASRRLNHRWARHARRLRKRAECQ
jgi:hypothetical protein